MTPGVALRQGVRVYSVEEAGRATYAQHSFRPAIGLGMGTTKSMSSTLVGRMWRMPFSGS